MTYRHIMAASHNVALIGSIVLTMVFAFGWEIGSRQERKLNDSFEEAAKLRYLHSGASVGYAAGVAGISTNRLHEAIDQACKELK